MTVFSWCGCYAKKYKLIWNILSSFVFAVIFGIRYNVGTDFPVYLNNYELACVGSITDEFNRWEVGFRTIFLLFAKGNFHYSFAFGTIAFLQCFFVYLGLRNYPKVWVFIPLTLVFSCIWISYSNIMRHMMAFSILVYALSYLAKRKYVVYIFWILIASLFHKTALILLPLSIIFSIKKEYFKNISLQYILLFGALVLMNINVVQDVFDALSNVIAVLGYESYESTTLAEFDDNKTMGLGFIVILLMNIIFIAFSNTIKSFYSSCYVSIMYDLYYIGILIKYAFIRMFLLQRLNYYFYSFEFIIGALILSALFYKKQYMWFVIICSLYFVLFIGKMVQAEDIDAAYKTFLSRQ